MMAHRPWLWPKNSLDQAPTTRMPSWPMCHHLWLIHQRLWLHRHSPIRPLGRWSTRPFRPLGSRPSRSPQPRSRTPALTWTWLTLMPGKWLLSTSASKTAVPGETLRGSQTGASLMEDGMQLCDFLKACEFGRGVAGFRERTCLQAADRRIRRSSAGKRRGCRRSSVALQRGPARRPGRRLRP